MGKTEKILVILPASNKHKKMLEEKAPVAEFLYRSRKWLTKEMVHEADIIIGNPPVDFVRGAENLKWLQLDSAGAENFVKKGILSPKTLLTNATGAYGLAISEYMIGTLLALYKKLHLYRDNQNERQWMDEGPVHSIYGCVALIIGLGDIGGEFAKRMKALGGYTIGIRRTERAKPDDVDEVHLLDQLDALLPRADVVALSLPGTKETTRLFSANRLKLMKREAVLINVGRGTAIDTDDLYDALENRQIAGAALDVTDPEPLPEDHKLWGLKNVIITPHISGGYHLPETFERIIRISAENLARYTEGKKLMNIVNPSTGYRQANATRP